MTDDDLGRSLRAWADATDPTGDPVAGADVRAAADIAAPDEPGLGWSDADVHQGSSTWVSARSDVDVDGQGQTEGLATGGPPGPKGDEGSDRDDARHDVVVADGHERRSVRSLAPWALVAAAVLVVVAAVIVRVTDEGPDRVTTDPTTVDPSPERAAGTRTQVIVESTPGEGPAETVERVEVLGPDDEPVLSAPLWRGTSLVLDRQLEPGRWKVRVWAYQCARAGRCASNADGTPVHEVTGSRSCDIPFEVDDVPVRFAISADGLATDDRGAQGCPRLPLDPAPTLTVPPAWSLRERLPWTCGTAALDAGTLVGPDDREAAEAAWQCFTDAAEASRPVELPTSQIGPTDDSRRVWWRVDPAATRPIERVASPWTGGDGAWTIERCEELPGGVLTPGSETGPDCTPTERLSLDVPPLDDTTSSPTPATDDGQTDVIPVEIVIEAGDPPVLIEGIAHRWIASVDGTEVASGPIRFGVEPPGDVGGVRPAQSTLVAEVEAARGAEVTVVWELYACPCPAIGSDGAPVGDATERFDECRTDVLVPTTDEPVVLVSLRSNRAGSAEPICTASTAAEVPALTVPPAWSLREVFDPLCGDDWAASMPADPLYPGAPSPSRDARLCLLRRFHDGARAEMTSSERLADGSTREVVFRVQPGAVELVRMSDVRTDETWTRQICTGLAELGESPWIEATGCGPEEEMPLTPP